MSENEKRWEDLKEMWWKVWNRIVYRKPVGDEGITYKMTPRWRRRKPTAKQVHQYEADLLDRWTVYVCRVCGDITDPHGEPIGCVNPQCDAPAMDRIEVAPVAREPTDEEIEAAYWSFEAIAVGDVSSDWVRTEVRDALRAAYAAEARPTAAGVPWTEDDLTSEEDARRATHSEADAHRLRKLAQDLRDRGVS